MRFGDSSYDVRAIDESVRQMRERAADRDASMEVVDEVRAGNIDRLYPRYFSDDLPKSIVSNLIDVAAQDIASMQAPLPSLACSSGKMSTAADRRRAENKNKIGTSYWDKSRLQDQMFTFADSWNTYGFSVFMVEADHCDMGPKIRVEDAVGCYYDKDLWGNTTRFAKVRRARADTLAELHPQYAHIFMYEGGRRVEGAREIELVTYMDREKICVYLPECEHMVLAEAPNRLTRVPVVIAERPRRRNGIAPRGQFDDVVWIQVARSLMAVYQIQAADKSVNAPMIVTPDVAEVPTGPDAVIRSDQGRNAIGRADLSVPREVFGVLSQFDQEAKIGARYPDARTNGVEGSIITGRGVEALLGGLDTQIKTAQSVFSQALEEATSLCFEMDVTLFGRLRKEIHGVQSGRSYSLTYVPNQDIGDNWTVRVTYGFAAGMTPAQAIVMLLQLRGDKWIGRNTARSHMPFDIDPVAEQQDLDIEDLEQALLQGMSATVQAIGPMALQGQDPLPVIRQMAKALALRRKGKDLYEAVTEAFKPEEEPEQEPGMPGAEQLPPEDEPAPGGEEGELPPGVRPSGLPQGVAAGQQGMPPGGMPSIQSLISGFRPSGGGVEPRMSAETLRKRPMGSG